MIPKLIAIVALYALVVSTGEAHAGIVVGAWDLGAGVRNTSDNGVPQWVHETSVQMPLNVVSTAEHAGGRNTTTYEFSQSGDSAEFLFDFDHLRMPGGGSFVESIGWIRFDVAAASPSLQYAFSGNYAAFPSYILEMTVRLTDMTVGEDIFLSQQWSQFTLDESFNLGELGGDFQSMLIGKTSGLLTPSHQYRMSYRYLTFNGPSVAQGGHADGALELLITPEPTSSVVFLMAATVAIRRRTMRETHR